MHETEEDLERLRTLMERSIEQAGTFVRESLQMPEHSLSARQLVHLWQEPQTVAFATVTKKGEPRVSPIGALLIHSYFYIPTLESATRTRHVVNRPGVSFTLYQGNELAVIAHGNATIIWPDQAAFAEVESCMRECSGQGVSDWGEGVFLRMDPAILYTYARELEAYPEE